MRAISETHSISAAARAQGMSYKRAWLLIDSLNQGFGRPVVVTATGGKGGGGAELTELGATLVQRYRTIEEHIAVALDSDLASLRALLK